MKIPYVALCLFLILPGMCHAQKVTGKVTDSMTGEPVAFANVFFSGTLNGTTTDLDGSFELEVNESGKYELIVSFVGYNQFTMDIESGIEYPSLDIKLEPDVIELQDIYVNADTAGRKNNFISFKELFIGRTANARNVSIANPKDIFLYYDHEDRGLFAHSRKEIVIDNNALGYRLTYIMKTFEMDYSSGKLSSFGIPRFEEMGTKRKVQTKRWMKARKKAYLGSFGHFLHSLKSDTFIEEGFIVRELFNVPNRNRPPQELIDKKLSEFRSRLVTGGSEFLTFSNSLQMDTVTEIPEDRSLPPAVKKQLDSLKKAGVKPRMAVGTRINLNDSVTYWSRMNRLPLMLDSLGMNFTSKDQLMEGDYITYTGQLRIIYTREPEDPNYALQRMGGGIDNKQTSTVFINKPLKVYENGYFDPEKVLLGGYFGWSARIAEMLPFEYQPELE